MRKLTVITHCWNEARMLPYFLRHYTAMGADRIVVYIDRQTTDSSQAICWQHSRVEIRDSPVVGMDDGAFVAWAAKAYKEFRGQSEWLIWVDADEFIYHKGGLLPRLDWHKAQGHLLIQQSVVWQMVSEKFPTTTGQIYDEVKRGHPQPVGKPVIFQPQADIEWVAGKHQCRRSPPVTFDDEMLFLHFRMLGLEYHLGRNHANYARFTAAQLRTKNGWHVNPKNDAQQIKEFNDVMRVAVEAPL